MLVSGWLLVLPGSAAAGMPIVTVEDLIYVSETGTRRLEVISFCVVAMLLLGWIVQRVWNGMRNDFPRLPRLNYLKAQSLVLLWSLLFVLVLTMISGARELMTPGAWEKEGSTYKLVAPPQK